MPPLYNAYSIKEHLKSVEHHLKKLRPARKCSHPDCLEDETLHSSQKLEHHHKSEHGQSKGLRHSQHLTCR